MRIADRPAFASFAARDAAVWSSGTSSFEQQLDKARSIQEAKSNESSEGSDQALRSAVESFEAYFIHQMIKGMRQTIPEGGLFEKSFAREIYEDAMDQERSANLAAAGGIGLAKLLYDQLAK